MRSKAMRIYGFGAWARAMLAGSCLAAAPAGAGETAAKVTTALRVDTAIYDLGTGVLQFAFTFANPGDSVLYLDCQVPPRAVMHGNTLVLTFSRSATDADGALAGGPAPTGGVGDSSVPAAAVRAEDFPPQRIAGGQTFQGRRRLDRVLGAWETRPRFGALRLKVDYYPERPEGEGPLFVEERGMRVTTSDRKVVRKGKARPPAKPVRIIRTPK